MLKIAVAVAALTFAGSAYADEVVIHHDDAAPVATESSTTVEHHESADGCASKSVHKEDGMGDSKTVTKSNC